MNERIFILLPVYNRCHITKKFITSLKVQTYTNYHLVLIDDGSTDGTEEMARGNIGNLTVLKGDGNWWWAGSLQQGIDWLKKNNPHSNDIILMINDDVVFDHLFLERAKNILENRKNTLLLAQIIDKNTGEVKESGVKADFGRQTFNIASKPEEISCLSTRGLFLRYSDLLRIGDFYPRLLPHYGSDYEYTIRAHNKGLKLITTPEVSILPDATQTGYHSVEDKNLLNYIFKLFSKKSVCNPVYRSAFIILTSPKLHLPKLLILMWTGTLISIIRRLFNYR